MGAQRIFTFLLWMAVASHTCIAVAVAVAVAVTVTVTVTVSAEGSIVVTDLEDEVVKEAINAGRGHRDEEGKRDQWNSKEHLGEESKFDSRRPISLDVQRLLKTYRLECSGCDHSEAVSLINDYIRTTKLELQQQARKDWWIDRGLKLAALLVCAVIVRFVLIQGETSESSASSLDDKKLSEIQQLRQHQQIINAAAVQRNAPAPPTWRDNEEKEIWTTKQEKQFQKALREFGGVGKKERYVLIAAQIDGKSRIECLTHHRLQQFREEQQQKDQ